MHTDGATLYCLRTFLVLTVVGAAAPLQAAGKVRLEEPATDSRVFSVTAKVDVTGQLETAIADGKALPLDLKVDAALSYLERRLAPAGRDAAAVRSLRQYDDASSRVEVQKQPSFFRLRGDRKLVVAQGAREGIVFYSPSGTLHNSELDLLNAPGDNLPVIGLLPPTEVEVGSKWTPESWVIQMLTSAEAVLKSELECELTALDPQSASITFKGSLEGATDGAITNISVSGKLTYDLALSAVTRIEVEQTEKRLVGAVSPGMNVTAKAVIERKLASGPGPLTDEVVNELPLEPDPTLLMVALETPSGLRILHDRNWHLFHQSAGGAMLRLLDKGSLIAQCNMQRIAPAAAGEHTPEEKFQSDIRNQLGERLREITLAEEVQTDDGRFLYRVTAAGEANKIKMVWLYYLCAAPDGRQVSFVFALEEENLERLANRDLGIVKSLTFLDPQAAPTRAAQKD